MTYTQLLEFVQECMPKRMQHIYLPLLIGELIDSEPSKKATFYHLIGNNYEIEKIPFCFKHSVIFYQR